MIQKKDIKSLVGWSLGGAEAANLTLKTVLALTLITNKKMVEYMKNNDFENGYEGPIFGLGVVSTLMGAISGTYFGARSGASMKDNYDGEELKNSVFNVATLVGGLMGFVNAISCAVIGQSMPHYKFGEVYNEKDNNVNLIDTFDLKDFTIKASIGAAAMIALGCYVACSYSNICELDVEPLSVELLEKQERFGFETLEKKNKITLEKALKQIKKPEKDVFKALEKYNKIYKRKFTELGTPMEMAKRANKIELVKELESKNKDLILEGLYRVRNFMGF